MSSCDVCIGTDEDFSTEFCHETRPKARKPVKCCECLREVPVGTVYVKIVGKWEGDLGTYRQCVECAEIQRVFACGKAYLYECLWQDMNDFGFESLRVTSPCFQMLSVEARAFLMEQWWKWKER